MQSFDLPPVLWTFTTLFFGGPCWKAFCRGAETEYTAHEANVGDGFLAGGDSINDL